MKISRIVVIVGARPTFIHLSPIIQELQKTKCEVLVYHTGQHYDKWMSAVFMNQLNIPKPKRNLHSGSGTHAKQASTILKRCEECLLKDKPDVLVVAGDTTSAFASSLAAAKLKIPVVHIEAGCRTYDKTLPEEINRVLITHLTSLHFPPTINCKNNLLKEGVNSKNIHLRGLRLQKSKTAQAHMKSPSSSLRTRLSRAGISASWLVVKPPTRLSHGPQVEEEI